MDRLWLNPTYAGILRSYGLARFEDFMDYKQGTVIRRRQNGTRSVTRIQLGLMTAYLKREFCVAYKQKLQNWWEGFGAVGKCLREWQMVRLVRQERLLAPLPLACGQRGRYAFLLLAELEDCVPLNKYVWEASAKALDQLIVRLARWLARFHFLGFAHPDLYSWHVCVRVSDQEIGVLDLARAWRGKFVPWSERTHELATLVLSLKGFCLTARDYRNFLVHYLRAGENKHDQETSAACLSLWRAIKLQCAQEYEVIQRRHFRQGPACQADMFATL